MVVTNYRNVKLFLNTSSCVQCVSKWYVYKHNREVLHSVSHSAFNVLNMMMGIEYINKLWPHIRIIYTFLKLQLPECIQPKQTWLRLSPPTPSIRPTSLNHPTYSLLLPGNCFTFFTTAHCNIIQSPLWFLPKGSNLYVTSCLQPDINASCRQ